MSSAAAAASEREAARFLSATRHCGLRRRLRVLLRCAPAVRRRLSGGTGAPFAAFLARVAAAMEAQAGGNAARRAALAAVLRACEGAATADATADAAADAPLAEALRRLLRLG